MKKHQDFVGIIDDIYTAATDPTHWRVVLDRLSSHLGCIGGNIHMLNSAERYGETNVTNYVDPDDMLRWNRDIAAIDPWNEALFHLEVGQPYLSHIMCPVDKWTRSEAFEEFYER